MSNDDNWAYDGYEKFNNFDKGLPGQNQLKKILFFGNSITVHGPAPDLGWNGSHGMAASSKEKDYVHIVVNGMGLTEAQYEFMNCAELERGECSGLIQQLSDLVTTSAPDVVVIQLGDNATNRSQLEWLARNLSSLLDAMPHARVYMLSTWWGSKLTNSVIGSVANRYEHVTYVNISDLYPSTVNFDRKRREYDHAVVNEHPRDWGMKAMADRLLSVIRDSS